MAEKEAKYLGRMLDEAVKKIGKLEARERALREALLAYREFDESLGIAPANLTAEIAHRSGAALVRARELTRAALAASEVKNG